MTTPEATSPNAPIEIPAHILKSMEDGKGQAPVKSGPNYSLGESTYTEADWEGVDVEPEEERTIMPHRMTERPRLKKGDTAFARMDLGDGKGYQVVEAELAGFDTQTGQAILRYGDFEVRADQAALTPEIQDLMRNDYAERKDNREAISEERAEEVGGEALEASGVQEPDGADTVDENAGFINIAQLRAQIAASKSPDSPAPSAVQSAQPGSFDHLFADDYQPGNVENAAVRPSDASDGKLEQVRTAADNKYQQVRANGGSHEEAEAAADRVWQRSGYHQ